MRHVSFIDRAEQVSRFQVKVREFAGRSLMVIEDSVQAVQQPGFQSQKDHKRQRSEDGQVIDFNFFHKPILG